MFELSRRSFLASASVIPFAIWSSKYAFGAVSSTRYSAYSPEGKEMLKIYAAAVKKMRDPSNIAEADPTSWTFQWYIHSVPPMRQETDPSHSPGPTNRTAELNRVYPFATSPNRVLADKVWTTCENHKRTPGRDRFFLPWHRMYVYFFEQIIRKVSGVDSFTLPYWNYSVQNADHGILPIEFRSKSDPTYSSLYVTERNPHINNGAALDQGWDLSSPNAPLKLGALEQCTYDRLGSKAGFCNEIDQKLHGNVHGLIGTGTNMGSVPFAGRDPIFWLHHCNIDRLWASWNKDPFNKNPTDQAFLDEEFVFADGNGQRVATKVRDFVEISSLAYTYDKFEALPTRSCEINSGPIALMPSDNSNKVFIEQSAKATFFSEDISLKDSNAATLIATKSLNATKTNNFSKQVKSLKIERRIFLELNDLKTKLQPGVLFKVFLDLPSSSVETEPTTSVSQSTHFVGAIQFFSAPTTGMPMDHGPMDHGSTTEAVIGPSFSFDITDLAKSLASQKLLMSQPVVTILPAEEPVAGSEPIIGEIKFTEQNEIVFGK